MFSKLKNLDFTLLSVSVLLTFAGIAVIYSLVFADAGSELALKQGIFFLIGLFVMFLLASFDYRILAAYSWYLYLAVIALLIIVDVTGKTTGGATRWIDLKIFQLQPSELYKFVSITFMAGFFSRKISRVRFSDIAYMLLMLLPPLLLILIEPDLGTALVIIFSWFAVVLFSKLTIKQYISILTISTIFAASLILSVYKVKPFAPLLKDYQRNRVLVFMNPSSDPFGKGYNVSQAKITIGSGGLIGKGLGNGTQSQLQFLPKPETDFIFAGFSEAFGFIGDIILFAVYILLLVRTVDIAKLSKDNLGYIMAVGIGATFLFQIVVNIAMNIGLAPVTGIPLPFISAGGTSLIVSFGMIGLLESIYIHRKKITF